MERDEEIGAEKKRGRWEEEQARQKREAEKGRHLEEQAIRWSRARMVSDYLSRTRLDAERSHRDT